MRVSFISWFYLGVVMVACIDRQSSYCLHETPPKRISGLKLIGIAQIILFHRTPSTVFAERSGWLNESFEHIRVRIDQPLLLKGT
jgi:hypothetical protein